MSKLFRSLSRLPGDNLRNRQQEWKVWYAGVPERMSTFYDQWVQTHTANGRFWGALDANQRSEVVHMPLAGDIASMSADLLFSEPPEFSTDNDSDRVQGFIIQNKINQRILHAAELCAAVGGVYLKIDIDSDEEFPVMTVRYPESTSGKFKANGDLKKVKFSRIIHKEKKSYRLYEKRFMSGDDLDIEYTLHLLKEGKDGKEVSLSILEETQDLENVRYPQMGGLAAVYIPNSLPNRMFPESDEGISDYAQVISLLDSLDEAWTSWINDITLGKGKVFIDQEIMRTVKGNKQFDVNQKAYTQADFAAAKGGDGHKPIESVQLAIRAEDHLSTCTALVREIVQRCGYAPQTFGLDIEGRAESGTAIRLRERKSMLRKGKKARYWVAGLKKLFQQMQLMDQKSNLGGSYDVQEVEISLGDSIIHDPKETSETVRNLSQAGKISVQESVRMQHPDWGEDKISEEVDEIMKEEGLQPVPEEQMFG